MIGLLPDGLNPKSQSVDLQKEAMSTSILD